MLEIRSRKPSVPSVIAQLESSLRLVLPSEKSALQRELNPVLSSDTSQLRERLRYMPGEEIKELIDQIKSATQSAIELVGRLSNLDKRELKQYVNAERDVRHYRREIGIRPRVPAREPSRVMYDPHGELSPEEFTGRWERNSNEVTAHNRRHDSGELQKEYAQKMRLYEQKEQRYAGPLSSAQKVVSEIRDRYQCYKGAMDVVQKSSRERLDLCFSRLKELRAEQKERVMQSVCRFFDGTPGSCRYGLNCAFSHGS